MNKQAMPADRDGSLSVTSSKQHTLTLICRKRLELSGVKDVLRFDETVAELSTVQGDLAVDGRGLRIETFDTERGIVLLTGEMDAITYLPSGGALTPKKGGFFFKGR